MKLAREPKPKWSINALSLSAGSLNPSWDIIKYRNGDIFFRERNMKVKFVFFSFLLLSCLPTGEKNTPEPTEYPIPLVSGAISSENASELILLDSWQPADASFSRKILLTNMREVSVNKWAWRLSYNFRDADPQCRRGFRDTTTSNNPNYVISVYCTGDLRIIDKKDSANYLYWDLEDREFYGVEISPSKEFLALFAVDGTAWFVPVEDWGEQLLARNYSRIQMDTVVMIDLRGRNPVAVTFSDDSSLMVLIFGNWDVQIWDLKNSSSISEFTSPFRPQNISFSPGNKIVTVSSEEGVIDIWDVIKSTLLSEIQMPKHLIKGVTFSSDGQFLISLDDEDVLRIWGIPFNLDITEAIMTATAASQLSPTPTHTPFSLPTPTLTPTPIPPSTVPIYAWPIKFPTIDQIEEIRNCNIREMIQKKYPSKDVFEKSYNLSLLESPCDLGAVASAYYEYSPEQHGFPNEGKLAFTHAFKQNHVIAFADPLFYQYFGYENLVGIPPQYDQPVKSVIIDYGWSGLGEPHQIRYHIEIDGVDSRQGMGKAIVRAEPQELSNGINLEVSQELINGMSMALSDFIPIKTPFSLVPCTDNYPDWKIKLFFSDNQSLELRTYGSNMLYLGGPWYTEIDGLNYLQYSGEISVAVEKILVDMGLPLGQPFAMTCYPENVIDKAFP